MATLEQTVEKLRTALDSRFEGVINATYDVLRALAEAQQEIDSWRERYLDKKRDFEKQAVNWAKDQAEVARLTAENERLRSDVSTLKAMRGDHDD